MNRIVTTILALGALAVSACADAAPKPVAPVGPAADAQKFAKACEGRDGWADPAPPFRVLGNVWYVGTCGITALLVSGNKGHVLIDAGPAEAAPLVLANIRALGFRPGDVRWILASHEHGDHAAGLAELKRETGAQVAALAQQASALSAGRMHPDDPQFDGTGDYTPVKVDRVLADGDIVSLGNLALTAHSTPAHAPGSTSWTWKTCDTPTGCVAVAYADSATAISADTYRFSDHPERIAAVRQGLARIGALPCSLLITPHPGASDLLARIEGHKPLLDEAACRNYANAASARFDKRLAEETRIQPKESRR